ncbi:maleylpyruvate isomerase family mycothiol-dependent enzyme [Streptomyces beijiangensis]|uniref:Maleylpyruvate isomerase family mycothiol-dependent enzyme n=1 Tax=Streptomyces beijiangensis TaxID=163361 RepID=A0A939F5I3_9ACTN|nr:maleylpyruvate isomerase family mycothiol-dependent enzyme [Streptomyces beijiangensis]MBO0512278.1 maleylpyruvate isomerase family mycothiol-dependent enzyme [Streptomyces beijiangensis]
MTLLTHERYCDELIRETGLLRAVLAGADLSVTVPTCPDWNLGDLVRHVGAAHRWAEIIVRTKSLVEVPDDDVPGVPGPGNDEPAALEAWLAEGADLLAATLREAGPDAESWTWAWEQRAGFWARRMVHETVIHRADAASAAAVPFETDPEVAADTVDEWLQIVAFSAACGDPEAQELRGAGRSIHLHATDAPGVDAEWLIEFGDEGFTWRRGHEKANVALRGPLSDVLQVFYRRLPSDSERVEVLGDAGLLDFWLARASFA